MSLSNAGLDALNQHWAVAAIGTDELARAANLVNERLAHRALGTQISFSFEDDPEDEPFLERVALAYELAAIEGLDELSRPSGENPFLREQAAAASFRAFDIRRLLSVPTHTDERLFFVLQLSAIAYCGDRWSDLRRWFKEQKAALEAPSVADVPWDCRLLYRLFDCWIRLFRKDGWDDLDRIREIIAGLRNDQTNYEEDRLSNGSETLDRAIALRLAALYNWAKATEVLANYMLHGEPGNPFGNLDKHFESGIKAAAASCDAQHEVVLRWLHASARIMVTNSLWWATRTVSSSTSEFVRSLTRRQHKAMFELLPPQRAALLEQGLLDQAKTAIVIDMPTSGGKTLLAQFRMLQALNQFRAENGWVVHVTPTRALSAQIARRLRKDFEPIGLRVEQLTAAVEVDAFEEQLLADKMHPFDVLVATPEKLSLVIRNKKVDRPLALVVMDEAHNIESEGRGLRIEFLLATVKQDCPQANFLLLMPYVEQSDSVARWLAQDVNSGRAISLSTAPWKPNERIIGLYMVIPDDSERAGWRLNFETLTATEKAMPLHGIHCVDGVRPLDVPKSRVLGGSGQKGLWLQTAAIGAVMSARGGTSIAVANKISTVWKMAGEAARSFPKSENADIRLVQKFLRTEISPDFELIGMLDKGVGVHHAGLSDDVRALMEWLAETGNLRLLCATSTISQGIDYPVSSVFLSSRFVPREQRSVEIAPREFWNLAGRAGRLDHDSVGVVGLCEGTDRNALIEFVSRSTGALVSRLVVLLDELAAQGELANLSEVLWKDQWEDFRCYIAHLWAEKKNLDAVLADSEQLLRQTYGYTSMRNDPAGREKADALLHATRRYAHNLADMSEGIVKLADSTGFSPEGVTKAMRGLRNLETKLETSDWAPESLFGNGGKIADLFGVMLQVPQLKALGELGRLGSDGTRISEITKDWVNGKSIETIAREYFSGDRDDELSTTALTDACRAIYRTIVNNGTWGVSALCRVSGINFEALSETEKHRINALPAMIYHGVKTEDAVLMRMNYAPRSIAEGLGDLYREINRENEARYSVSEARSFLRELDVRDWDHARPEGAALSGNEYKQIWELLSGDAG